MSAPRPDLDALLDAGDEDALGRAMHDDPELAGARALQRAIDASLRHSFAVPDLDALHQRLDEAAQVGAVVVPAEARPARRPSWRSSPVVTLVATAAAMVLVVLVLVGHWGQEATGPAERREVAASEPAIEAAPSSPGPPTVASRWVDLYQGLPSQGFGVPEPLVLDEGSEGVSCASDGSSALAVRPTPGLTVRSECSDELPCRRWGLDVSRAVELTVDPQGLRVLVFVHRAEVDPRPSLPAGSRFHLYRRQLGHLVLYELSPLARAVGLDAFEL